MNRKTRAKSSILDEGGKELVRELTSNRDSDSEGESPEEAAARIVRQVFAALPAEAFRFPSEIRGTVKLKQNA